MDESEILVTTAQVAIGLAGFTGVASVLSQRSGSTSAALQAVRLRTMIELSLLAAGFALLPLALDRYEVLRGRSWRLASGLYLLAFASQFSFASRRISPHLRELERPARLLALVMLPVAALAVILLGVAALGLSSASPSALYVSALLLQLAMAGFSFHRFFTSLSTEWPGEANHSR